MHELRIERSANTHRLLRGKCEFSLMRCNIRSVNSTLRSVRLERMVKPSAPSNDDDVPNAMQYTIRKLYSTERKETNHPYRSNGSLCLLPPTLSLNSYVFFFCLPYEIQYTIRELYSTERKGTLPSVPSYHPYGWYGSLSLLTPTLSSNSYDFSQVSLMRCNLRSVNCTLRSVRALNHPHGSNGSLLSLLPPHYHETALFF